MSVTYFPQVSGALTSLPYAAQFRYDNYSVDIPESGKHYSYANFATPLGKFGVNWPSISDAEAATLEAFFKDRKGRFKEFVFLDPGGNLVPYSEDFSDASWTNANVALGAAAADPFGGSLAKVITATSAAPSLVAPVLPDGAGTGILLCASAYVRSTSGAQQIKIGFSDSIAGDQGFRLWDIDSNWRRIFFQFTVATANVIRVYLSGWSNAGVLNLFGVQVAPLPGPGSYAKSPGRNALHRKCHFGIDKLEITKKQWNENVLALPIEETF
ncbi:MAG TPA: hypothetical protein VNH18_15145 [Bryobacteraceae bacterium]|nr:hypothetical protein [Bryobacteraceae bacterium]